MNAPETDTQRIVVADPSTLAIQAVACVRGWLLDAIESKGRAVMALAGGKTPEEFYAVLGQEDLPWEKVLLLLGDERIVPAGDSRSNAAMVRRSLMAASKACRARFLAPDLENQDPQTAAHAYEAEIAQALGIAPGGDLTMDVVILGLGIDGHTASLFPGSPALMAQKAWIFAVPAPDIEPRVPRLTMTLPVINRARHLLFLATGPDKLQVARRVWEERESADMPAAKVCPKGKCLWIVSEQM